VKTTIFWAHVARTAVSKLYRTMDTHVLDIPTEVFVCNILPLLDVRDLVILGRTCKKLYRIVQDEHIWKQHLFVSLGSEDTFKSCLHNVVEIRSHLDDLTQELENEEAARATSEQMRVVLESNLDREMRINQELATKVKVLEEENVWLMESQKNQILMETDLRRAMQELESLRRQTELYEERLTGKDRELKLLERRKENLEAELKEMTEELSELRVSKRDLVKLNRQLKTELVRAIQTAQVQKREGPSGPTNVVQLMPALPKNKF